MFTNINMKKIVLWLLIITVACFAIAIAISVSTGDTLWSNGNLASIDESKALSINDEKIFGLDGIKDINIHTVSEDITFIPVDEKDIKIHFHGKYASSKKNSVPELITDVQGDNLKIEVKHKPQINIGINLNGVYQNLKLDIYIPRNFSENIDVSTTSSEISIDTLNLKNLNCKTVSGNITANTLNADDISISTTSGNAELVGTCSSFSFNSVSGSLYSQSLKTTNADIKTTSGNSRIKSFNGNLEHDSVSGDIFVDYSDFNSNLNIKTTSGDANIKLPENSEFHLNFKSTSGDLNNEFPITVKGKTSRNSMEGTVGSDRNKIEIHTVSGDVNIIK